MWNFSAILEAKKKPILSESKSQANLCKLKEFYGISIHLWLVLCIRFVIMYMYSVP